jgi:hypothetical protein
MEVTETDQVNTSLMFIILESLFVSNSMSLKDIQIELLEGRDNIDLNICIR